MDSFESEIPMKVYIIKLKLKYYGNNSINKLMSDASFMQWFECILFFS